MARSRVFVEPIAVESSREKVADGIRALLRRFDLPRMFGGRSVLIKPNLCGEGKSANTDPRVIYGVVRSMEGIAARIAVGDASVIGVHTTDVMAELRLGEMLADTPAELMDLKLGRYVDARLPDGRAVKHLLVAEAAAQADAIISVAKLKTNNATGVSFSIKNLKGILHEYDNLHFHHVNLSECLVDLLSAFRPALSIVDGLIGLDSHGSGITPLGYVMAGEDPVAVDSAAARAIGVDPAMICAGRMSESHIKRAYDRGLGEMLDLEVVGALPQAHFTPAPIALSEICTPDGMEIIDGDPCPACIGMLGSVLQKLTNSDKKRPRTTILVGPKAPPPEKTMGRTIIIGNCLHRVHSDTEGSVFVVGCPPNANYDLLPALEA
jgi:uncharacterized protein (DUF362 family)